ncbi:ABC transporter ATP-binding protein [Microvirga arabica]|uniref:ABC transporter ATP-binding protein n=1 Tax=Microvirga arabica TaxID=1128671 RepID=UPI001939BF9F|nr:ABC transporter ATP-binding protein [Microvirga arabica]MBM1171029.1 ABC transporter ATP-binding protein [Microvirga arabica]
MTSSTFLNIQGLSVGYGRNAVLSGIDLELGQGEFIALLGSSGCGKTTLLRTLAGFMQPSSGRILVAGRDITHNPPERRDMALVFQSYALWPHMSVRQNVGYGLKVRGIPRSVIGARVDEVLTMLGLDGLGDRPVTALSGGQRQRVALGRALAIAPQILLLDEPLSNLDARIRLTVRHEIRSLQQRLGITAVHVTHDREEAMVMADRIVILNQGRIEQVGSPEELYRHPASAFVATFLGADNVIRLHAETEASTLFLKGDALAGGAGVVPRPEHLTGYRGPVQAHFRSDEAEIVSGSSNGAGIELLGIVKHASYPGGIWRHAVAVGDEEILVDAKNSHAQGANVRIRIPADALFVFPAEAATQSEMNELQRGGATQAAA